MCFCAGPGRRLSPLTRRRLQNFRANRRGFWSLWIFLALFGVSLVAEVIANDRPLVVRFDGAFYFPIVRDLSGDDVRRRRSPPRPCTATRRVGATDPREGVARSGRPFRFRYDTINYDLPVPAAAVPGQLARDRRPGARSHAPG